MSIERIRDTARASIARLLEGVDEVVFVDFPDYGNVGDSAIALGMLRALELQGVHISSIGAIATLPEAAVRVAPAVVINGGGNLGGLYPLIDEHRIKVAELMSPTSILIQGPQTIRFVNDDLRLRLEHTVLSRPSLRIGVRDRTSLETITPVASHALLCPDAAHVLGKIEARAPRQRVLVLQRMDDESADSTPVAGARDWLRDSRVQALTTKVRWQSRHFSPAVRSAVNPSPSHWRSIAAKRLRRGVDVLSLGEIVVTDRLHALILALALGRSVIAVDNNNSKLSEYAKAWLHDADLDFASNFSEALQMAERRSF